VELAEIENLTEAQLDEVLRRGFAVKHGKRVRVKVKKRRAGRLSIKQKRSLKKARRKAAHSSVAKRHRRKSMKIRKRRNVKNIKGGNRAKSRSTNR